ncbi:MerR family transcriptional regulator [Lacisediminihabitans profunda]|uniref:MerR family transcriptional regulator n=1 Tax=Lacisediminihabitans profunda TaxID=2594790 RepID=A0A5C8UUB3_9MICO|nr:MerR family transcriptional regulator [Lacisediminihabitans profunda]TXN32134.1 MerR family transcriptional regulator [Lacisediminihabitans profunda]
MTVTESTHSISEAAELTGLSTHTLRYYERTGLMLTPVDRASSTHRRYSEADVRWVGFLTKLRSTGLPIARVRQYVELVRTGESTVADRLELLLIHRINVAAQLDEMTNSLAAIDFKIATYQGRTPTE